MKGYCNMTELALFGFVVLIVGQVNEEYIFLFKLKIRDREGSLN